MNHLTLALTLLSLSPLSLSAPIDLDHPLSLNPAHSSQWLGLHNFYRDRHNASPLKWSPELQASAQEWADQCNWYHSKNPTIAENLAYGYPTPQAAIKGWYDEVKDYDFETKEPVRQDAVVGHFKQVVWKGAYEIGCAMKFCGSMKGEVKARGVWSYVCHYHNYDFGKDNVEPPIPGKPMNWEDPDKLIHVNKIVKRAPTESAVYAPAVPEVKLPKMPSVPESDSDSDTDAGSDSDSDDESEAAPVIKARSAPKEEADNDNVNEETEEPKDTDFSPFTEAIKDDLHDPRMHEEKVSTAVMPPKWKAPKGSPYTPAKIVKARSEDVSEDSKLPVELNLSLTLDDITGMGTETATGNKVNQGSGAGAGTNEVNEPLSGLEDFGNLINAGASLDFLGDEGALI